MGVLAEQIVRTGLGDVMQRIYDQKPAADPQVLCAAVGDLDCDSAPFQATQFEANGSALVEQIKSLYLEGGGGGNGGESYFLAWAFAVAKVKADAFTQGRKGYLFTIGDECVHRDGDVARLNAVLGTQLTIDPAKSVARTLVERAREHWHVFHLIVKPVADQPVVPAWRELMGERAIVVEDPKNLAVGIAAIIEHVEGIAGQWTGDAALVVRDVHAQLTATK